MPRIRAAALLFILLAVAGLAGCGPKASPASTASHSAQASAAAADVAPIINTCLGKIRSPLGVIDLALSKGARRDFAGCLSIPSQNQDAFLGAAIGILNDYRKSVRGMDDSQKAAAHEKLLADLSALAARYQHVPPLAPGQTATPSAPAAKASVTASATPARSS